MRARKRNKEKKAKKKRKKKRKKKSLGSAHMNPLRPQSRFTEPPISKHVGLRLRLHHRGFGMLSVVQLAIHEIVGHARPRPCHEDVVGRIVELEVHDTGRQLANRGLGVQLPCLYGCFENQLRRASSGTRCFTNLSLQILASARLATD